VLLPLLSYEELVISTNSTSQKRVSRVYFESIQALLFSYLEHSWYLFGFGNLNFKLTDYHLYRFAIKYIFNWNVLCFSRLMLIFVLGLQLAHSSLLHTLLKL